MFVLNERRQRLWLGFVLLLLMWAGPVQAQSADYRITIALARPADVVVSNPELTVLVQVNDATLVVVSADNRPVPFVRSGAEVRFTTSAAYVDVLAYNVSQASGFGTVTKALLKDDKQLAYSHSFDDNAGFQREGIAAITERGWVGGVYLFCRGPYPACDMIPAEEPSDWLIDEQDIAALARAGWTIGNHTWDHGIASDDPNTAFTRQNVRQMHDYLRTHLDAAGLSDVRLTAFAAPFFDSTYQPIIMDMRADGDTDIQFNESGDQAFMLVDPDAVDDNPWDRFVTFDFEQSVGRDARIGGFGTAGDEGLAIDLAQLAQRIGLDGEHVWYNTFLHDIDESPDLPSFINMLDYMADSYGAGGAVCDGCLWVDAPHAIFDYLTVREHTTLSATIAPLTGFDSADLALTLDVTLDETSNAFAQNARLTNAGPSAASGVIVQMTLPQSVHYSAAQTAAALPSGWTIVAAPIDGGSGTLVLLGLGALQPAAPPLTLTAYGALPVSSAPAAPTSLWLAGASVGASTLDVNPANNSAQWQANRPAGGVALEPTVPWHAAGAVVPQ